jgi:uncharacterized protein (TIGR02246 family)
MTKAEGAAYTAVLRVRAAWDAGDAEALAGMFTDDGSILVGEDQLCGRDEIRAYFTGAFAGPYAGTKLVDEPAEIRFLAPGVAFAITKGGVLAAGAKELSPESEDRATWILREQDGDWRLVSQQTSPIKR